MKQIFLLSALSLFANTCWADLWISILSRPPQPEVKAFGVYTHCPDENGFVKIEAYEFIDLITKNKIGEYSAEVVRSNTKITLLVEDKGAKLMEIQVDTSRSFAQAPFTYRAHIFLVPEIYDLTPHQSSLSAIMLNPLRPEMSYQPSWDEDLVSCQEVALPNVTSL